MGDIEPRQLASKLVRVVAAVIDRDGRLLVAQRPLEKRHGGLWELPGGKCEAGETDAVALARELREEFGVRLTHVSAVLAELNDSGSPYLIAFLSAAIEGEPECREHIALCWATVPELMSMPLAPTDHTFISSRLMRWRGKL